MADLLDQLVDMSRALGVPANDYVILGEGNTSVRADEDSFWVKGSGTQLATATRTSFVRVRSQPILASLGGAGMTDDQVKQVLAEATAEGDRAPSIETFLHALCLQLDGVRFVGHTHPTAALAVLSCHQSRELFAGSLFPDQIVLLGPAYVYVPYTDPGLPLALAVRDAIDTFVESQQRVPKVVLMENHGVIALGGTPQDVLNVTQMLVKTCRIVLGTLSGGGPRFLLPKHVQRIDRRPDELARRRALR
jgi:rhamnose utilization protein RhaD (predicted bifunctional aldolase and dehydrogenase)